MNQAKPTQLKTTVFVTLQLEGLHCWPGAVNFPEVAFLQHPHRHLFHFYLEKKVNHDDRDIEFILFKREVENYLKTLYADLPYSSALNFGTMSCEAIATDLALKYQCSKVIVSEDGENGAVVEIES